jgi:hypothetical protein
LQAPLSVVPPKKKRVSVESDVLEVHRALRDGTEQRRREDQAERTRHNLRLESLEERRVVLQEAAEASKLRSSDLDYQVERMLKYAALREQLGNSYTADAIRDSVPALKELVRDEHFCPGPCDNVEEV